MVCVLDTALCDKVCQLLAIGRWFSLGIPVSSTNKTDRHDTTEILLKVVLSTIILLLLPPINNTSKTMEILYCLFRAMIVQEFDK